MLRLLRSILLFITAAIALVVMILWIKSYLRSDTLCWDYGSSSDPNARRTQRAIQSRRGQIVVGRLGYLPMLGDWKIGPMGAYATGTIRYRSALLPLDWIGPLDDWGRLGFAWRYTTNVAYPTWPGDLTIVTFPHWSILLLLAPWPATAFARWRRRRHRKRNGLCLRCGYDLQGIKSDRCPECGTNVNGPTPSPTTGE